MKAYEAIQILTRLEKSKLDVIPVEYPAPIKTVKEPMLDKNTGNPLIDYVNRIEYMDWLRKRFNLVRRGGQLKDVLRRAIQGK